MQRKYELTVILKTSVTSSEQKKVFDEVKKFLGKEGKIKDTRDMGKKVLSYKIKKEKEGNYFILTIEGMADTISKISNMLKLSDKVIRFLIVRI